MAFKRYPLTTWPRMSMNNMSGAVAAAVLVFILVSITSKSSNTASAPAPAAGAVIQLKPAEQVVVSSFHQFPESYYQCLDKLPPWATQRTPMTLKHEIIVGSTGLTDKTDGSHLYEHMYHRYLSVMARRTCDSDQDKTIRILEIGLGCSSSGGMKRNTPGGSALAWRHLFPSSSFNLELHIMEFDEVCARKWAAEHQQIATVHTGDASSSTDLDRVVQEAGGKPFDVIIDDASHLNEHQIATFQHMIQHVAPGGFYVIEDIHSSCAYWPANTGAVETGQVVDGTSGCMVTQSGAPTIYAKIVEWQKMLLVKQEPFPGVNHIDLCLEAAVIQKEIR